VNHEPISKGEYMRKTIGTLLLVAAAGALAVGLLAGCGGSTSSSGSGSPSSLPSGSGSSSASSPVVETATFTNSQYGFSFDYDSAMFKETSDTSAAGAVGGNTVFEVGFFDENGTKQGDQYRDGFVLGLYQLNAKVDASMMPAVQSELEKLLPELGKVFGSGATFTALTAVDVDGTSGFTTDATYDMEGTPFKATMYFLIKDDVEYQFTMQGAASRWSELEPGFQQVIDTFTVK
jgi:hypothetical protein